MHDLTVDMRVKLGDSMCQRARATGGQYVPVYMRAQLSRRSDGKLASRAKVRVGKKGSEKSCYPGLTQRFFNNLEQRSDTY